MKNEFIKAIEIITKSNSPKVSFRVPVKINYGNVYEILIHESNAHLIDSLIEAGYSLSMCSKGLRVDVIGPIDNDYKPKDQTVYKGEDIVNCKLGLYQINWKDEGGSSIAAIGQTHSGEKWVAPTNWTNSKGQDPTGRLSKMLKDIDNVILLYSH